MSLAGVAQNTLFPYPSAPDTMSTTMQRFDYAVEHFWDRCNFQQGFSQKARLQQAFNDYIKFMPHASAPVAHASVDRLIEKISKQPAQLLAMAEMAEGAMYSDTASVLIDELYLPFAQAVVNHKKIKPAEKARYAAQVKILSGAQVGMKAPDFTLTHPDGTKEQFNDITGSHIILFFNNPDCTDCIMARARLSADYNIGQFIKRGQVKIVSVYPGDPTDEDWIKGASRLPKEWTVGACEDVDQIYDMRRTPAIYYLKPDHTILSKTITVDQLINRFREINLAQPTAQ